jgi:hypothetical protein
MDETDLSSFLGDIGMTPSADSSTWQTPSDFNFGDISGAMNGTDFSGVDMGNIDQILSQADLANTDWSQIYGDSGMKDLPAQDFGGADTSKYMDEYQKNLQDTYDNKSGFTSGWQQSGSDRIMVQDDGSAIGINENGDSYSLTPKEVAQMDKNGLLNSATSGYNAITGGTNIAPGGGKTVINADGTKTITMPDGKTVTIDKGGNVVTPGGVTTKAGATTTAATKSSMDPMTMMMLMMLLSQMGKGGGGTASQAVIPKLQANRSQLPYTAPSRPGAGGTTYFSPTTYTPMARGGITGYANGGLTMQHQPQGISSLGGYSDGGRLLKGPGDGVSDGIPATIAGKQPARLANGEFVVPARIVSELGNGSTDAGAQRLYEMMDRVQKARRKTKNVAADTKAHKYLPA